MGVAFDHCRSSCNNPERMPSSVHKFQIFSIAI